MNDSQRSTITWMVPDCSSVPELLARQVVLDQMKSRSDRAKPRQVRSGSLVPRFVARRPGSGRVARGPFTSRVWLDRTGSDRTRSLRVAGLVGQDWIRQRRAAFVAGTPAAISQATPLMNSNHKRSLAGRCDHIFQFAIFRVLT